MQPFDALTLDALAFNDDPAFVCVVLPPTAALDVQIDPQLITDRAESQVVESTQVALFVIAHHQQIGRSGCVVECVGGQVDPQQRDVNPHHVVRVVAATAQQTIAAPARDQHVVVGAAVECVVSKAGGQGVVAGQAGEGVGAVVADDPVRKRVAGSIEVCVEPGKR